MAQVQLTNEEPTVERVDPRLIVRGVGEITITNPEFEEEEDPNIITSHSRFRDAKWYGTPKDIIIGGAGGIGSWLGLFLGRIGHNLIIFDTDSYDNTNLAGQFCTSKDLNVTKTAALAKHIHNFCGGECNVSEMGFYDGKIAAPIMFSGFDNMKARKAMFEAWKAQEDREIFIDGRLSAELGIVFTVVKGREDAYEATLFDDNEVQEAPCSYKATSHCGAMIAGIMTSTFNNWLYNVNVGHDIRVFPFKVNFELPILNFEVHD